MGDPILLVLLQLVKIRKEQGALAVVIVGDCPIVST